MHTVTFYPRIVGSLVFWPCTKSYIFNKNLHLKEWAWLICTRQQLWYVKLYLFFWSSLHWFSMESHGISSCNRSIPVLSTQGSIMCVSQQVNNMLLILKLQINHICKCKVECDNDVGAYRLLPYSLYEDG